MDNYFNTFVVQVGNYLPTILAAIGILIVGWIVAALLSRLIGNLLSRTSLDDRVANMLSSDQRANAERVPVERWIRTVVFWLIMLFAIVAALNILDLGPVTGPFNTLLDQILGFIPALLSAAALLFVAWLVATVLRMVIVRVFGASGVSRRLSENAQVRSQDRVTIGETIGNIVYWLVFLLFLPAILGALNLQGILAPVQNMVNEILAVLPNILAAAMILAIGYIAARIVRQIVTGLLAGMGVDRIGSRAGIPEENRTRLSNVLGTLVYVLILIPVAIAALNIPAISNPATQMLTTLLDALPAIFGAVLLLALAYFVARILGDFVGGLLSNLGVDRAAQAVIPTTGAAAGTYGTESGGMTSSWSPSRIIGTLITVAVILFAVIAAANLLGFEILATMVSSFLVLGGNILLGLVIFGLGLYLASLADRAIRGSGAAQANVLGTAARAAIIVFTAALALRQMGIGEDIVNLAFGLLLGAIAVAAALAFGLGGRDVAAQQLQKWQQQLRTEGGSIPRTGGKSVGESLRDSLQDDMSKARDTMSQAKTETGPDTGIKPGDLDPNASPPTRPYQGPGSIPSTGDAGDMGDVADTSYPTDRGSNLSGGIPDTGSESRGYQGGSGMGIEDEGLDYQSGLGSGRADLPDRGDEDMAYGRGFGEPGTIPPTGSEETDIPDEDVSGEDDEDDDTLMPPPVRS